MTKLQAKIDALIIDIQSIALSDDSSDDFASYLDDLHKELDDLYTQLDFYNNDLDSPQGL